MALVLSEPATVARDAVAYAAIRTETTMEKIPEDLPILWPSVYGWITEQGATPSGAPFIHYHSMDEGLNVSVGIPVPAPMEASGDVVAGEFPSGDYLCAVLTGPYDLLREAHASIHDWANERGVRLGYPTESYLTDPGSEPDPNQWRTEIAYEILG